MHTKSNIFKGLRCSSVVVSAHGHDGAMGSQIDPSWSLIWWCHWRKKEIFYLTTHSTHFIYGYMASDSKRGNPLLPHGLLFPISSKGSFMREGYVLFNNALNTFYLWLYGVRHMVKDHSDSEKGNLPLPHRLLLSINSKCSFICTIPQTG